MTEETKSAPNLLVPGTTDCTVAVSVAFGEMNADKEHKLSFEGGDKSIGNPETYYSNCPTTLLECKI